MVRDKFLFGRSKAGALRHEPVELVKCETNELLVPANAEIILEGECLTGVRAAEGPFGEYPGYCTWLVEGPKEIIPRKMCFNEAYPEEVQEKVTQSWRDYGYK